MRIASSCDFYLDCHVACASMRCVPITTILLTRSLRTVALLLALRGAAAE